MQCTDIAGFRQAVASCLPMRPGHGLGECPALAAAAQKYGTQCLDLAFFQGGPPIAAYACGKNAMVTAATQSVCNKLPNRQYHQTVVSGPGSGSGSGSGGGSGNWSDFVDSSTGMGRYGAWGDDNEGWQTTSSVGAGLGTAAQAVVGGAVIKRVSRYGRKSARGIKAKSQLTAAQQAATPVLGDQRSEVNLSLPVQGEHRPGATALGEHQAHGPTHNGI